jgi:hypothetical protein
VFARLAGQLEPLWAWIVDLPDDTYDRMRPNEWTIGRDGPHATATARPVLAWVGLVDTVLEKVSHSDQLGHGVVNDHV